MAYSKTTWVNNETKLNAENMNKIENGIETNSNNMPTDINTDSNGYLILEHDGVEITGQKKLLKYPFTYDSNTNTVEIGTNLDVNGNIETNGLSIWKSGQYEKAFLEYQYDVDNFRLINYNTNAITNIPLTDGDEITLVSNRSLPVYYVHYLKFTAGEIAFYGVVYSSNNIDTNTLQNLTTLLKPPSSCQMFISLTNDNQDCGVLYWSGSKWQVGYSGGGLDITGVTDRVEPI